MIKKADSPAKPRGKKKVNYGVKRSFRFPPTMDNFIVNHANVLGLSETEMVRHIIAQYMKQTLVSPQLVG